MWKADIEFVVLWSFCSPIDANREKAYKKKVKSTKNGLLYHYCKSGVDWDVTGSENED